MQDPQYFMYNYQQTGDDFSAIANGDLDGNGTLSTFSLSGKVTAGSSGGRVVILAPSIGEVNPED
jgi:hypothetical protein